ncbi:DNA phosphorothioation system sulfurtransferase DndC [Laedolimicola ammoniilytica]|uniref:DNA phosphorothioation system sulfurtransferase DndC n=1 Tax=Laedolimicola ammoniilytica TaxID=2981771 RepID=A0ABT2RV73_9FIRM|nr:DNA phosphorothioation system sulfurtransferase DndC [Laedolimicola ammoniilytica]MCU6696211.1 DNA phosphorothioation system sulfurtransferase DndC [Laedolimicola ammoniilytica]SCH53929.1 PUA domain (predicted RNA-binding domain) [uncultured Clostridium sp.]
MANLTRDDIREVIETIKGLYLEDMIPWICGYSGGKDSTAVVQLVWMALSELPADKLKKTVHVISTDTLVESPVVAIWATESLRKMKERAKAAELPIIPHRLTPTTTNTFWVNLIGRGYPYPRRDFRWCTDRLKIDASNRFIKEVLDAESEAILVLGSRKAESATRKAVMEGYEKKRYRENLSPNGSFPNSYVFTPIENWQNDNVWQFLMQYENPWGHSNKDLLAMYSGASADGECPLVIDTSTPSCGNSRFGCWVCTMVAEDKSMAAMIQNDEEKSWMLPMLDFRNYIAGDWETDRRRRDFRRRDGHLTWYNDRLVHGPYTQETREDFLRRLLQVEKLVHEIGPDSIKEVPLITMEELKLIRQIWLDEFHEFEDNLPKIYEEETGKPYQDGSIGKNKYFGAAEAKILKEVCDDMYGEEELLPQMLKALLDVEAKAAAISNKRNVINNLEKEIKKAFYKNEEEAQEIASARADRLTEAMEENDREFVE